MEIIYKDGTIKNGEDVYESAELKLARASYDDNIEEIKYILRKYPNIDVNAIVKRSKVRGNGTALILTGKKEIAKLLLEYGADINLMYDSHGTKITALDSANRELEKERAKDTTVKKDIHSLIDFLKSNGGKNI